MQFISSLFLLLGTYVGFSSTPFLTTDQLKKEYIEKAQCDEVNAKWELIEKAMDNISKDKKINPVTELKETIEFLKNNPPGNEFVSAAAGKLIGICLVHGTINFEVHQLCTTKGNYDPLDKISAEFIGQSGSYDDYMDGYHFLMPYLEKHPPKNKTPETAVVNKNRSNEDLEPKTYPITNDSNPDSSIQGNK